MQSALTAFWILSGLGLASGLVMTVVGLLRAPEGFEDEAGFHGVESVAARKAKMENAGPTVQTRHPGLA